MGKLTNTHGFKTHANFRPTKRERRKKTSLDHSIHEFTMAAGGDNVTLEVLKDRSLFVAITAFSSGVPYSVHQVKQLLICASDASNKDTKAPQDMELWQNAITTGDMVTLEALRVLSETPEHSQRLHKLLFGLPGFALTHTRDLALLDWLDASFPYKIYNNPVNYEEDKLLGAQGHVEVIEWIVSHDYGISGDILLGAAGAGHMALLQYVHESLDDPHFCCVGGHMEAAAANGHLEVVRFLFKHRAACMDHDSGPSAFDRAVANDHLEIVQFLHENQYKRWTSAAMDGAVVNRHIEVVQFLHDNRYEGCSSQALVDAVKNSEFEALQLLCEHRGDNSSIEPALQLAAELAKLKYVRFLYNELSPAHLFLATSAAIVTKAAASGFLELIRFFHTHDQHFQFSRDAMHSAAVNGHLSIVKFLHEHRSEGCNVNTLFQCDERGHARILEFFCSSRPMAKPVRAIAKAKKQGRVVLAAMLERCASTAKKAYVYR